MGNDLWVNTLQQPALLQQNIEKSQAPMRSATIVHIVKNSRYHYKLCLNQIKYPEHRSTLCSQGGNDTNTANSTPTVPESDRCRCALFFFRLTASDASVLSRANHKKRTKHLTVLPNSKYEITPHDPSHQLSSHKNCAEIWTRLASLTFSNYAVKDEIAILIFQKLASYEGLKNRRGKNTSESMKRRKETKPTKSSTRQPIPRVVRHDDDVALSSDSEKRKPNQHTNTWLSIAKSLELHPSHPPHTGKFNKGRC